MQMHAHKYTLTQTYAYNYTHPGVQISDLHSHFPNQIRLNCESILLLIRKKLL